MSAKLIKARRITYSRRVNRLHPCICADSQSGVFEVDASAAVVVPVPIAVAVPATLLVPIRACVALVADPKVGANTSTSEDNERDWNTNFNPFGHALLLCVAVGSRFCTTRQYG